MGEGNLVDSALYLAPLLVIDAIGIDDLLHIIISKCGELERERVVFVGEMEFFRIIDTMLGDGVTIRIHIRHDGLVVDEQAG